MQGGDGHRPGSVDRAEGSVKAVRWGVLVLIAGLIAYWLWPDPEERHPPGVLVAEEPDQRPMTEAKHWQKNGYDLTALAQFRVRALVLHRERYSHGPEADLSPLDLALGWGPLSDQAVIDQIDISQGGRWYRWRSKKLPVSNGVIITHSANMHLIPANGEVEETLLSAIRGNIVDMQGYLVEVRGERGWKWVSSLRRDDTGGGSCELVWVEKATVTE
jgi:hypothetical protein